MKHFDRRALPLLMAPMLLLAACGGGSEDSSDTTVADSADTGEVTTLPAVTTVPVTTTAPAETTASTVAAAGIAPLTGLPVMDAAMLTRPALAVKIDNHTDARPHAGLNQADIVYEEIVEGITRFFAIYQSTDAGPVGPVRSARTTDVDLLNQLNRPLFAYSGGNAKVVSAINGANAEPRKHADDLGYYRDAERRARAAVEHTLLIESTQRIYATVTPEQGPPAPFFSYRPAGTPLEGGDPVSTITLDMNSVPVMWTWDAAQGLFLRDEYGEPHLDTTGAPISAANVVVQFCDYRTSAADPKSPEAVTVGSGDALVYTDGKVIFARWERPDAAAPAVFTGADGSPIALTPGRTWIELGEAGDTTVTTA